MTAFAAELYARTAVICCAAEVFCGHSQEEIQKAFQGKKILSISRKGKYFWAKMSGERQQALFHFGMTGHLLVRYHGHPYTELKDNETWPPRFTKLELVMDDGTQIVFTDARRYCTSRLTHISWLNQTNINIARAMQICKDQACRRSTKARTNQITWPGCLYRHAASGRVCQDVDGATSAY